MHLPGRASQIDQNSAMRRVGEIAPHADVYRRHVQEIVVSAAFRNSKRSQYFLQFVVDRSLEGAFESLKERSLGVELFGRPPSYDTDKDAIVRVAAREVRRRLAQYYVDSGDLADLRIDLAPGSYIPEFRNASDPAPAAVDVAETDSHDPVEGIPIGDSLSPNVETVLAPIEAPAGPGSAANRGLASKGIVAIAIVAAAAGFGLRSLLLSRPADDALPWSAVLQSDRRTHIIFCDPDIVTVQMLMKVKIPLADYANKRYFPNLEALAPEIQRVMQAFQGTNVAAVDSTIATKLSTLLSPRARERVVTHSARRMALADFKTDDHFVILGSPRSNPWVDLFRDQMGFHFESDILWKPEYIRNTRPAEGEPASYVPTAGGWKTGEGYGVVALVNNPNQTGRALILAGTTAESTEAVGAFATNPNAVREVLQQHRIGSGEPFEILLRVKTMAGSSTTFDVAACHKLK